MIHILSDDLGIQDAIADLVVASTPKTNESIPMAEDPEQKPSIEDKHSKFMNLADEMEDPWANG
jgi:hypothetical protein